MEQAIRDVAAIKLLEVAQIAEDRLDEQIKQLDNLGEDELEIIRQNRRRQLQNEQAKRIEWLHNDHGVYLELADQNDFFSATKSSERLVVHFYRSVTARCEIVDRHLGTLAADHAETRVSGFWLFYDY